MGAHAAGTMSAADVHELEGVACPGAGACGGQFTANTMSLALEFLGISPAGLNGIPALDPAKAEAAEQCGKLALELVRGDVRPSAIITRASIENAIAAVAATGGSTNAVLHLLAIARELGLPLELDDFDEIATRTPVVADLKPGGRFVATDLHRAGGVGLVARELVGAGLVDGSALNVDGRTLAEIADATQETPGQEVVVPIDRPLKESGGLAVLRGNLASEGAIVKLVGHERRHHRGPARVFDSEEECFAAVSANAIVAVTPSSSATKVLRAAPACGRCSTSPLRSSARGSVTRLHSSPTDVFPARRTGSWWDTSRPKQRGVAGSRRWRTGTRS